MTLSGSSVSLPLPDLIPATAYAGRTCCVALRDDRGRTGTLGFDHGELVRASFGELRGDV